MSAPLVHVLVINWNGLRHLDECFTTLLASTYERARFFLIDNGSTDNSADFVRERFGADPRVEVLRIEKNSGWSGGNNAGLSRALADPADYALLLNNDTAIAPDCIAHLVRHAEAHPEVGALAPKILLYDAPELLNSIGLEGSMIGAAWDRGLGRLDDPRWDDVVPVIGVCGAACFLRVEALNKTGLLAPEFEIYLDDYDLGLRIWDAGYRIETCPAARVRHKFSATMGAGAMARRKYYLNTRNRLRVIARNFPVDRLPSAVLAFARGEVRAIGRALLDGEPARVAAHARSWLSGTAYAPKALSFRRAHAGTRGAYWNLLRRDLQFFPGVELPEQGWYRSRNVAGRRVRPMSRYAHYLHEAGKLRVNAVNAFPTLRAMNVTLLANGAPVAHFATTSTDERTLDLPRGDVVFKAESIFYAEETGYAFDTGGCFELIPES